MHMVHMSTQYSDVNNALQAANSLTVLGIMFEVRDGRISSQLQRTYHYVLVGGGLIATTGVSQKNQLVQRRRLTSKTGINAH